LDGSTASTVLGRSDGRCIGEALNFDRGLTWLNQS
jgi:hypothetical protein